MTIKSSQRADGEAETAPLAVQLSGISKRFGFVQANQDVDLAVRAGTIHGIIGENGAGKSTLVSILFGFYHADSGDIRLAGTPVRIRDSADAIRRGIGMVHQHFMLVPNFTALENIVLGHEGSKTLAAGLRNARKKLQAISDQYGLSVELDAETGNLPVGVQQRIEILKALYRGARILILDEPTGVLTPQETEQLFAILDSMRQQGVTVLLITHKLHEVMAITDNVSVMRDGQMIGHRETARTTAEELAELMVGRPVLINVDHPPASPGEVKLQADSLSLVDERGVKRIENISFQLRGGEILGVAGVSGNGQSELLAILSGMATPGSGSFRIKGHEISARSPVGPARLRKMGLAHVPEDRHAVGLILPFNAAESAILGYEAEQEFGRYGLLKPARIQANCRDIMGAFDVRPPDPTLRSNLFSGGNQQKLVLAREISSHPDILLVGQPTRGVDIGAIEFIHSQLIALRDKGCAILMVSVELDEIMSLSDRIMVLNAGVSMGIVDKGATDVPSLGQMMAGLTPGQPQTEARS